MTVVKIDQQNSERDIINVAGDVILFVNQLTLPDSEGIEASLIEAEQNNIRASFSAPYGEFLKSQLEGKILIKRNITGDVERYVKTKNQVLIHGEPGAGKSCALYQLLSFAPDAIYLSLRGKSPTNIVNQCINRIRIKRRESAMPIGHLDQAVEVLQSILSTSGTTFFIDDCEAQPELATILIGLFKGDSRFVFASRNRKLFDHTGIVCIAVTSFSEPEAKEYLKHSNIELEVLPFNELYLSSKGNPLYLFYFTKFQISPLPSGLEDYHRAIWNSLSPNQQHYLSNIAISYRRISIEDLSALISDPNLLATIAKFKEISSLITNENGIIQIFHPVFADYIIRWMKSEGVIQSCKETLGSYYLKKEKLVDAAWLLLDTAKINEFGIYAIPAIAISGDLHFGVSLILRLLTFENTDLDKGYLEYHLSIFYRLLNERGASELRLEIAIEAFNKVQDKKWLHSANMLKAMDLVESGYHEAGLELAEFVIEKSDKEESFKARCMVNLSKIYTDLTEYDKAAILAKAGYDIFAKLKDQEGMVISVANLASALTKIDDYDELAESYALKLFNIPDGEVDFGIRLIALNVLTSINRKHRKFEEAKEYGMQAVQLCQKFDLPDKLILNLINYGNIIRDEKKLDEAIKVYEEALAKTKEHGLKRDEGRVYWILASICNQRKEYEQAIKFSDLSISSSKEVNYRYGVAHALEEKAKIFQAIGQKLDSAKAYEESAKIFLNIEQFSKDTKASFSNAIKIYFELGEVEKANSLLALSIVGVPHNNFYELERVINKEGKGFKLDNTIHESFLQLAGQYSDPSFEKNTIRKFFVYLDFCNQNKETSKSHFLAVLKVLAENVSNNRFARSILAILLDQSRELIDEKDLFELETILESKLPKFHKRDSNDGGLLLAAINPIIRFQIHNVSGDLIAQKLAVTLALFLYAAPELIIGSQRTAETFYKLILYDLNGFIEDGKENLIPKNEFTSDIQTLMLGKADGGDPDNIYIGPDYEITSDLIKSPGNKCLNYFLGQTILRMTDHFYVKGEKRDRNTTKYVIRKLAYFFDYTNVEEIGKPGTHFNIDLETLLA